MRHDVLHHQTPTWGVHVTDVYRKRLPRPELLKAVQALRPDVSDLCLCPGGANGDEPWYTVNIKYSAAPGGKHAWRSGLTLYSQEKVNQRSHDYFAQAIVADFWNKPHA